MEDYEVIGHIGEGAHGIVLKAKNKKTGNDVALKKIPLTNINEGIPCSTIREIKALQQTHHENIIRMLEICPYDAGVILVFEYMPSDLSVLLRDLDHPLSEQQIKTYMAMLLKGVDHIHNLGIMHRDLKPANLLIAPNGLLKIADFGQACLLNKASPEYTHEVATRWYRAPELLYGARSYDETVDLWAVGCIFAEMINKYPLLRGENDIEQLCLVLKALGTPTEDIWPGMTELPDYNKILFPVYEPTPMEELLPDSSEAARNFLRRFLVYSSHNRISAAEALFDDYFYVDPLPCCRCLLPQPTASQHGYVSSINSLTLGID